jgi:MFS family permease
VPLLADAASYLAIAAAGRLIRTRRGGRPQARARSAAAPAPPSGTTAQSGPEARWRVRRDPLLRSAVILVGAVLAAVSLVNVAEVFFIRQDLHATASTFGLLSTAWVGAAMAGGWLLGRRVTSDAALGVILLAALAVASLAVAVMAAVPDAGWLVPVFVVGGLGNGGLNVAAAVLLGRRAPAAARGHAFAVYGAVVNGASVAGYLLAGLVLNIVPERAGIAGAGLFGLAATGAFAPPVLRAARRSRADAARCPGPARRTPAGSASGA